MMALVGGAAGAPVAGPSGKHYTERPNFPADLQVLVLDPFKSAGELAKKLLSSCKYSVKVCHSCREAVAALSTTSFDVIVAEMKVMQSHDADAQHIASLSSRLPLVLLSDTGSQKDVWSGISLGAADVLCKPLSRPKLQTLWQHTVRKQGPSPRAHHLAVPAALEPAKAPGKTEASAKAAASKAAPPGASSTGLASLDGKKRKAKEMSSCTAVAMRPPLAIKPAGAQVPCVALPTPAGGRQVQMAPMLHYFPPPMMATPPGMIADPSQMSWGHPVMGMPTMTPPGALVPGQTVQAALPPQVIQAGSNGQGPVFAAAPMIFTQLVPTPMSLPAEQQQQQQQQSQLLASSVAAPALLRSASETPGEAADKQLKAPGSPDSTSNSSGCGSSKSEESTIINDLIAEQDLVTIPEVESLSGVCSPAMSCMSGMDDCKPTALDDINEEEYAFVDFALSDAFASVDDDDGLPSMSLKKSDSLSNILYVQVMC